MGKYGQLGEFLAALETNAITLSRKRIEEILGAELPASSRYRQWWANGGGYVQARAWMDVGWVVDAVDSHKVRFVRG